MRARILGIDGSEKFARDTVIDVPADSTMRVFVFPEPTGPPMPMRTARFVVCCIAGRCTRSRSFFGALGWKP